MEETHCFLKEFDLMDGGEPTTPPRFSSEQYGEEMYPEYYKGIHEQGGPGGICPVFSVFTSSLDCNYLQYNLKILENNNFHINYDNFFCIAHCY